MSGHQLQADLIQRPSSGPASSNARTVAPGVVLRRHGTCSALSLPKSNRMELDLRMSRLQLKALKTAGCQKTFREKGSRFNRQRPEFQRMGQMTLSSFGSWIGWLGPHAICSIRWKQSTRQAAKQRGVRFGRPRKLNPDQAQVAAPYTRPRFIAWLLLRDFGFEVRPCPQHHFPRGIDPGDAQLPDYPSSGSNPLLGCSFAQVRSG